MNQPEINQVFNIVKRCAKLLQGAPPNVQGAALADLLAMWIAGHRCNPETKKAILAMHVTSVARLVEVNSKIIEEHETRGTASIN